MTRRSRARGATRLSERDGIDPLRVVCARTVLDAARRTREARTTPLDRELFGALLERTADAPELLRAADDARAAWVDGSDAVTRLARRVAIPSTPDLVRSLSVLRAWAGRWLRFFVVGWWIARFAFRRALGEAWPERSGEHLTRDFLDDVADHIAASKAWKAIEGALAPLSLSIPTSASELGPFVGRVTRVAPAVREVVEGRASLAKVDAWIPAGTTHDVPLDRWEQILDARHELLAAHDDLCGAAARVTAALPYLVELPDSSALASLAAAFRRDAARGFSRRTRSSTAPRRSSRERVPSTTRSSRFCQMPAFPPGVPPS